MDDSRVAQPIVIAKTGTHEDIVVAAATASFFDVTQSEHYTQWKKTGTAKTVRRCSAKDFDKLAQEFAAQVVEVGEARAFAMLPIPYSEFPSKIRRLQVSGTDFPKDAYLTKSGDFTPSVLVRAELDMSTGKEAAQVAHAFHYAKQVLPVYRVSDKVFFAEQGHTITDSGLTEFSHPTVTVKIVM